MNGFTEDYMDFRKEVRDFIANNLPDDLRNSVAARRLPTVKEMGRWQKILNTVGWVAPAWPREYGGTGWPAEKLAVFNEEVALSGAPMLENLGILTIGPTIYNFGTEAQKKKFLPRILSFDDFWAQAYSEPNAGSDLASLTCAARLEGDHYVINGSKIWQSHAHCSNWAFTLVRTETVEGNKYQGITALLVDLTAPGVEVRPIRFMNGALFHSEIFFDGAKVPVENLVGKHGQGWGLAKGLLNFERLFGSRLPDCRVELQKLRELMTNHGAGGTSLHDSPGYAHRFAEAELRFLAFEGNWWKELARMAGGQENNIEISKIRATGTALLKDIVDLQLQVAGPVGLLFNADVVDETVAAKDVTPMSDDHVENIHILHFRYRGISLGAGSAEMQSEIIARGIYDHGQPIELIDQTDDQRMLTEAFGKMLERSYGFDSRQRIIKEMGGFDEEFWAELEESGVFDLLCDSSDPEAIGNLIATAETFGASLVVEPWAWRVVAACSPLAGHVEKGEPLALAWIEERARFDPLHCETKAIAQGDGWVISGRKILVAGASKARKILVSARLDNGDFAIFSVKADAVGIGTRAMQTYDGRAVATLEFDDVPLGPDALILQGTKAETALHQMLDDMVLVTCGEALGAITQALATTIEYQKTRRQFGRSLSQFQALRHRMVNHVIGLYHARSLVNKAVGARGAEQPNSSACISAAKNAIGTIGRNVGHDILQMHGAIGFQDETAISHYAKRLIATDTMFGDATYHLNRWINQVADVGYRQVVGISLDLVSPTDLCSRDFRRNTMPDRKSVRSGMAIGIGI